MVLEQVSCWSYICISPIYIYSIQQTFHYQLIILSSQVVLSNGQGSEEYEYFLWCLDHQASGVHDAGWGESRVRALDTSYSSDLTNAYLQSFSHIYNCCWTTASWAGRLKNLSTRLSSSLPSVRRMMWQWTITLFVRGLFSNYIYLFFDVLIKKTIHISISFSANVFPHDPQEHQIW